jgi:predicted CXXCH cytochrome family protein
MFQQLEHVFVQFQYDPNRSMTGQTNPLANWPTSVHAISPSKTANQPPVGGYATVGQNSCTACHASHNAPGAARLLRGANEQACIACHNGGANVSPAPPNVFTEFAKIGHPFTTGSNVHDAKESALLNQNRHATCVDCHNAHASNQVATFGPPPGIRPSQNGVVGVSGLDGVSVVNPAVNQFENCLRCHGSSTGKMVNPVFGYLPTRAVSSGDPLNVIAQFAVASTSSHPVMHDRTSAFAQPSLLTNMLNIDGVTQGRTLGARILCTDCHNSDDNREFGGTGASGPTARSIRTSWSGATSSARQESRDKPLPTCFQIQISGQRARMLCARSVTTSPLFLATAPSTNIHATSAVASPARPATPHTGWADSPPPSPASVL